MFDWLLFVVLVWVVGQRPNTKPNAKLLIYCNIAIPATEKLMF